MVCQRHKPCYPVPNIMQNCKIALIRKPHESKFQSEQRCVHQNFFWDGTDDLRDGNDKGLYRAPFRYSFSSRSFSIFLDHLKRIWKVFEECITDGLTDDPTDRRMGKASFRDAVTHLKIFRCLRSALNINLVFEWVLICELYLHNESEPLMK